MLDLLALIGGELPPAQTEEEKIKEFRRQREREIEMQAEKESMAMRRAFKRGRAMYAVK